MIGRLDQLALEGDPQQSFERYVGPLWRLYRRRRFPNIVGLESHVRGNSDPLADGPVSGL